MDSQISFAAMDLPDRHGHLCGEQKRRRPRKQSQHQKQTAEHFQDACDVDEVSRQAMLYEKLLHAAAQVRQLGVAMCEKDHAEGETQRQQPERLENIEGLHPKTSAEDSCAIFMEAAAF